MFNFFVVLTKYLIIITLMLYIVLDLFSRAIVKKKFNPEEYDEEFTEEQIDKFNRKLEHIYNKKQKIISLIQFCLIFLIDYFGYCVLYVISDNNAELLVFMVLQFLFLFGMRKIYIFVYKGLSLRLINNMLLMLVLGLLMICRLDYAHSLKQFVFIVATMCLCLLVPAFISKFKHIDSISFVFSGISLALLFIVLIAGTTVYGAKNWIKIGGILVQPSEFAKILFVFAIAGILAKSTSIKRVFVSAIIAGAHVLLLVMEKDLGGALIFFVTYMMMLVIASGNIIYLILGTAAGSGAAVVAYKLFSHVRVRVTAFLDPWSVIDNQGYQVTQALFAIGTGGWFGLGLGRGYPKSIPVAESDFIFAAICEEMGTITGVCIILLYIVTFVEIMGIAIKMSSQFYKILACGFGFMIFFQTFLCIGGVTKFIPSTGVTMPLISYGGSSVVSTIIVFNIIQGLFVLNQMGDRMNGRKRRKDNSKKNDKAKQQPD